MPKKHSGPRILFWDLEVAGVQALSADRGFITCFGYKFLGDQKARCLSLNDYPGRERPGLYRGNRFHDDSNLLRAAAPILESAELLVAHFGEKFDRPYFRSRLLRANMRPMTNVRQVDTCLIARHQLKLSSNRLANLADFFQVKTGKMNKGRGWPEWWMGAMVGDPKSIDLMSAYCSQDVQCLEECFLKMRRTIPGKYLVSVNSGLTSLSPCCGATVQYRGTHWAEKRLYKRFMCNGCGKWSREVKPIPDLGNLSRA